MRLIDADACPKLFDEEFKETQRLILAGEKHLDNLIEQPTMNRMLDAAPAVEITKEQLEVLRQQLNSKLED